MSRSHPYTLRDVILLRRGYDLIEAQRKPGNVPVVGSAGIHGYHNEARVKGPGITIGRSGGSFGKVTFVREDFWPHNTTIFVTSFKGNEPSFVRYLLGTLDFSSLNSGSAQQSLNRNYVYGVPVRKFSRNEQRSIAAILSAYDELIENNQWRIALLEKLAEEIYREWFVRLRFPGHEKVNKVKGVPSGWEIKKLGELVRTQYGYTASAETEGDGPKFLRITDIVPSAIDWERVPHCKIEEKDEEKYLLQEGDIVVARTGATVGYAKRINKRHPKAVFASYLVRLIPHRKTDAIFLGLSVEREAFKDFISMFVTGAAQPQANATTMALFPVLRPPQPLLNEFNRIAEPILDQKEILLNHAAALSRARDVLLPRLISGKLSVENLDIQFPPGMAEEMRIEPANTEKA